VWLSSLVGAVDNVAYACIPDKISYAYKDMSEFSYSLPPASDDDPYLKAFPFVDKVVKSLYRQEIEGIEHIPETGPALILANHLRKADSFTTPALIVRELNRRTIFAAKQSYFEGGVDIFGHHLRSPTAWFFQEFTHAIPVARDGKKESISEFHQAAVSVLNGGDLLAGYPEGTRSPDGRLYRARNGFATIALEAMVPIIPQGNMYSSHRGADPRQIAHVHFGEPIQPAEYEGMRPFELSELISSRIQALTGQEYVHKYLPTGKDEKTKFLIDLKRSTK
jgi:1-acyl-sn-glycerol-3-phosphate acyltransferase